MSVAKGEYKKVTTHTLTEMKQKGEKISMLTAYDYTLSKIIDGAGIDVILGNRCSGEGAVFQQDFFGHPAGDFMFNGGAVDA